MLVKVCVNFIRDNKLITLVNVIEETDLAEFENYLKGLSVL